MGKQRAIYLDVPEVRILDHWCEALRLSFQREVYLVGSVLQGPDHRDVDVRIMLTDEEMASLPMHVLDLNMMLSRWGQQATGLPIDCQVQTLAEFTTEGGPRNPRGYTEERRQSPRSGRSAETPDL